MPKTKFAGGSLNELFDTAKSLYDEAEKLENELLEVRERHRELQQRFEDKEYLIDKLRGQEEGETCWRNGCQAKIAVHAVENCSCHINPPCGSCTEAREYCPECDWKAADDTDHKFYPTEYEGLFIREALNPRPLDPSKIDYRITVHSNSSQCCEGVYPDTATQSDVEARVRGTFGGRFEYFKDGKFRYIAYTD